MKALCRMCDVRPAVYRATDSKTSWSCCAPCAVNALLTHMADQIRPITAPSEDP